MSYNRRNRSEVIFNNILAKEHQNEFLKQKELNSSKKGIFIEDTQYNIFTDSMAFPDVLHKKNNDFNFDDNLSIDNRTKPNRNVIRLISTKFHELYLKLVNENRILRMELQAQKNFRDEVYSDDPKHETFSTKEKTDKYNINNKINIGNLSLVDLNNEMHAKEKRNDSLLDENEIIFQLKEEETEMFNSIVNEFNIQISELDLKDDYLRREVIRKIEEVNKLNTELEQIIKNKQTVLTELQNVTLKLNEFKAFLASISTDLINKNENIIIDNKIDANETIYTYCIKNKKEKIHFDKFDINKFDEFNILINNENKDYVVNRLLEENIQYREVVAKMRNEAIKCEKEIIILEKEYSNLKNLQQFIMEFINSFENILREIDLKIVKITRKYNQKSFEKENE